VFPFDKDPNSVKGGCDPGSLLTLVLYPADIRRLLEFPFVDEIDIGLGNVEVKGEIGPYGREPVPGEGGALPL